MIRFFIIALMSIALACNSIDKKNKNSVVDSTQSQAIPKSSPFADAGDSLTIPSFQIEVLLSDKAEKKLTQQKESVIVMAMFHGVPIDTTSREYLEGGEKGVGQKEIELTNSRIAKFEGVKVAKKDIAQIVNNDIQVLINIYSGRRSTQDNLLDCEILQEPISKIQDKKHVLKGKLIGE